MKKISNKVIKLIIGLIPITRLRRKLRKKYFSPIKQHPLAASDGFSMELFYNTIKNYTTLKVENIFEIGANFAQDAACLAHLFKVVNSNVYVFEAHPDICKEIPKYYNFNVYNTAVFNEEKILNFNLVDIYHTKNTGNSSLYRELNNSPKMRTINIQTIRMDKFMLDNNISKIDFLKLDVEGCNWEVLDGFGERIRDINCIHIESEHIPIWENQKLYPDIERILKSNNFELVYFQRYYNQSDSFWIQKQFLINK